jgi:hypothetical protein
MCVSVHLLHLLHLHIRSTFKTEKLEKVQIVKNKSQNRKTPRKINKTTTRKADRTTDVDNDRMEHARESTAELEVYWVQNVGAVCINLF